MNKIYLSQFWPSDSIIINYVLEKILMKIILGTVTIIAILATGIVGINNVFAQGNNNDFIVNETTMTMNATLPTTIISNATLAFAQEGSITPEEINNTMQIFNDTSMTMMNATLSVSLTGNNTAQPMD